MGRTGWTADFLKGLIKLAAAGVKVRQGQPRGVVSHAAGAAELFRDLARQLEDGLESVHVGFRLHELLAFTEQIERQAASIGVDEDGGVQSSCVFVLQPAWGTSAPILPLGKCSP